MQAHKGYWEGEKFILPLRIYYEDTDMAGIVYHANYLRFAERARTEMVRSLGYNATNLKEGDGIYFVVRRCEIDFLCPAKIDDELRVECKVLKFPATNITVEQDVYKGDKKLAAMMVHVVCLNLDGRVTKIPEGLRQAYEGRVVSRGLVELGRSP